MTEKDKLIVSSLRLQSENIIKELKKCNAGLTYYQRQIELFKRHDEIQGKAYEAAKQQMDDYLVILRAIRVVNLYELEDCEALISQIGNEDLIGSVILKYQNEIKSKNRELLNEQEIIQNKLDFGVVFDSERAYFVNRLYQINHEFELNIAQLEKWQAKERKFDQISEKTSHLFQTMEPLRKKIKAVAGIVKLQFKGGHYHCLCKNGWKTELQSSMLGVIGKGTVELQNTFPHFVDRKGRQFYGGNQNWFYDGYRIGSVLVRTGCSLVALGNMMYYMEGVESDTTKNFVQRIWKYINVHKQLYNDYVALEEAVVPIEEGSDTDLQSYIEEVAIANGYKGATWKHDLDLEDIRDQLAHNIPVIYAVGGRNADDEKLRYYEKTDAYQYKQVQYVVADEYIAKMLLIDEGTKLYDASIEQHTVTITGVEERINMETGKIDSMLRISTWGGEYYISYDEAINYKESVLSDQSEGVVELYCSQGLGGASHVIY